MILSALSPPFSAVLSGPCINYKFEVQQISARVDSIPLVQTALMLYCATLHQLVLLKSSKILKIKKNLNFQGLFSRLIFIKSYLNFYDEQCDGFSPHSR